MTDIVHKSKIYFNGSLKKGCLVTEHFCYICFTPIYSINHLQPAEQEVSLTYFIIVYPKVGACTIHMISITQ